jgi:hypothetical protein
MLNSGRKNGRDYAVEKRDCDSNGAPDERSGIDFCEVS